MLGLKRGDVSIVMYDEQWSVIASNTIDELWKVIGDIAVDIQHIGSTSIRNIHAKPIIDIAVAVKSFDSVKKSIPKLEKINVIFRGQDHPNQLLFIIGIDNTDIRTHYIHFVFENSDEWHNYINFRDYLNSHKEKGVEYDLLKVKLSKQYANDRGSYTNAKTELIGRLLSEAKEWRISCAK